MPYRPRQAESTHNPDFAQETESMMTEQKYRALSVYGRAIYCYMVACDEFRAIHGRYPTQDEAPRPKYGDKLNPPSSPPVSPEQRQLFRAQAVRRKTNPTPGVTYTRETRDGKEKYYWKASLAAPNGRKVFRRAKTHYLACVARNEMVRQHYGDTRPELLIDLSKVKSDAA